MLCPALSYQGQHPPIHSLQPTNFSVEHLQEIKMLCQRRKCHHILHYTHPRVKPKQKGNGPKKNENVQKNMPVEEPIGTSVRVYQEKKFVTASREDVKNKCMMENDTKSIQKLARLQGNADRKSKTLAVAVKQVATQWSF